MRDDIERFGIRNRLTGKTLEGFLFKSLTGARQAARAANEYRRSYGFSEGVEDIVAFDRETQKDYPMQKVPAGG